MSDSNQLPPLGHASVNTWLDWSREALEGMENLLRLNLGRPGAWPTTPSPTPTPCLRRGMRKR